MRRGAGEESHRSGVDGMCLRWLILGKIHRRECGRINNPICFNFRKNSRDCLFVGNIKFRVRSSHDLMVVGGRQANSPRDLTAAQHQNSHANFSISANEVPLASLAESFGCTPGASGQRIASVGSSQANVFSCAGL